MYEISSTEMTFTNEYYDDGNLMTSAEYDEGKLIETGYYFWGNGVTTAIRQMQETVRSFINYYDLQGRRLSNQPMLHGIYVKNGKKIMVR